MCLQFVDEGMCLQLWLRDVFTVVDDECVYSGSG